MTVIEFLLVVYLTPFLQDRLDERQIGNELLQPTVIQFAFLQRFATPAFMPPY